MRRSRGHRGGGEGGRATEAAEAAEAAAEAAAAPARRRRRSGRHSAAAGWRSGGGGPRSAPCRETTAPARVSSRRTVRLARWRARVRGPADAADVSARNCFSASLRRASSTSTCAPASMPPGVGLGGRATDGRSTISSRRDCTPPDCRPAEGMLSGASSAPSKLRLFEVRWLLDTSSPTSGDSSRSPSDDEPSDSGGGGFGREPTAEMGSGSRRIISAAGVVSCGRGTLQATCLDLPGGPCLLRGGVLEMSLSGIGLAAPAPGQLKPRSRVGGDSTWVLN